MAAAAARKLKGPTKRKPPNQGHRSRPVKRPALSTVTNTGVAECSNTTDRLNDDGEGELDIIVGQGATTPAIPDIQIFVERSDEAKAASYNKPQSHANAGSKKRTIELGSALDDFINAATRCIKCRRRVPNLYFGNDKARECHIISCDHRAILIIVT